MNIHNLKLNEKLDLNDDSTEVTRVPGGWIYRFWDYNAHLYGTTGVFVPFDNEFNYDEGISK